uniref:CWF19 like cell cycle control factor 2 n=1 Tax=Hucho hucho TaxID=62062 RepID=A0A4W5KR67_9TELE
MVTHLNSPFISLSHLRSPFFLPISHLISPSLPQAKQQYEKEEKRKELKRQRGEDTWMLPEVDLRLQQLEQEVSGKKKKEKKAKKSKKSKKEKKKKKEKRAQGGDGFSASSEVSVIGLVYLCIALPPFLSPLFSLTSHIPFPSDSLSWASCPLDEWMTFDFLTMRTTSTAEKRAERERLKEEEKQKARVIEQAGLHKLELNPFWKDGGSGLPPEEKASNVVRKAATVDDGGLGWLRRSYQRMREQAEREQRSLEVIVAERYGSMEKFQKRMDEAEIAVYGYKRGEGEGRGRGEEEGRDRERWRRGQEDGMWRKGEEGMDRERWRRPDKGRDLPGEKERDGERERDHHRDRDRNRERDGDRERDGGKPSDRDRERAGGRERDEGRPSDRDREREEEEVPILTDEEMNKLGARLVKAEIMGNTALMEKLKTQLELARKAKENRAAQQPGKSDRVSGGQTEEDQEVLLFRTDQSGRAWPVNASSEPQEPRGGRRKKKAIETHRDGERMRYFQDDDSVGLHEMVRREKMSSAEDQNSLYARMAGKMMGKTDDDNYTLDDMFVSSVAQREGEGRDEERMRSKAIAEHRRLAVTMEKCHHCFSNPELQKHLLIAIGTKGHVFCECMYDGVFSLCQVPRGLPYFSVDFGLQGGFAHVIENEHKFPHYFGKEIVGGMLDVEPRIWRKSIRENFDDQRKKVLEFSQWWKPFDCTKTDS